MDKQTIMDLMENHEFSLYLEAGNDQGSAIVYHFLSKPVYNWRHKEPVVIPSFNCTVYPESGEFQFMFVINGITLESKKSKSLENEDHFREIYNKFKTFVKVLYQAADE